MWRPASRISRCANTPGHRTGGTGSDTADKDAYLAECCAGSRSLSYPTETAPFPEGQGRT